MYSAYGQDVREHICKVNDLTQVVANTFTVSMSLQPVFINIELGKAVNSVQQAGHL